MANLVIREVDASKPTAEDKVKPAITPASSKVSTEADSKKTSKSSNGEDKTRTKDKESKGKAAKGKKSKKTVLIDIESSSDSDSDSDLSSLASEFSSGSDSDTDDSSSSGGASKKKLQLKKRRAAAKAKKHSRSKKSKKPIKVQGMSDSDSDSDSYSSDSFESAFESSSDSDFEKRGRHATKKGGRAGRNPMDTLNNMLVPPGMPAFNAYQSPPQVPYFNAPMGNMGYMGGMGQAFNTMPAFVPPPQMPPINPPRGITGGRGGLPPMSRGGHGMGRGGLRGGHPNAIFNNNGGNPDETDDRRRRKHSKRRKSKSLNFKRVDQVWDNKIHNYKLQDTAEGSADAEYEGYVFHVRRTFDWEGKYKQTVVDIKSKLLRDALQEVMGNIKGVSLVEEVPKLDPNLLFLYLDDIRKHIKTLKSFEPKGDKKNRKKELKRNEKKRQQLKVLAKYLDKDYEAVKNSLNPLLANGLITFDLLWALWKPNTLAFTTTYGSADQPRIFKAEMAEKHFSLMKGDFYYIEGKYFEYDGKRFGFGSVADEIGEFRGTRKITSLPLYPLQYHKNEEQLRKDLIERGKKFVSLSGVQYKSYDGMAYYKKKKNAVRVNISGRIMIDSSIHRRINPNYPISLVRPNDNVSDDESDDNAWGNRRGGDGSDSDGGLRLQRGTKVRARFRRAIHDGRGNIRYVTMITADGGTGQKPETLDAVQAKNEKSEDPEKQDDSAEDKNEEGKEKSEAPLPEFSDEEYLIASPLVLGFAFAEKMWLEFTVSSVNEIHWNESAYQSLVLEPKTKDIVKALVESHKYHAAESIDDVIQGKGKGLVAVLHGPPGTGKTLTAEGISELLKCPLYMVSAGELGTDSRFLESELQKILDICHAWGAILLLDEADVFLEKRNMHDLHRNALVSIFLRQLEYFQGILFLTTNRVETFDDAFQSRIHIALRYDSLDQRAKKAIFKIFIERVRILEKIDLMPFTEEDYTALARNDLNGRQIKNTVRTAQALAVNKGEPLSMNHIRQVLEVQMSFDRDLKGGPGFQDAMRSYF
ncbi:hypothetical protein SBRCBS47491_003242 [Sporothrix bragantina]|uniref:AAA+ ATPase domain-containing protein n=1 Tax=Sporothrix bragantina TaxID=671064 RepID=A0ABP0BDK4_9PEZI